MDESTAHEFRWLKSGDAAFAYMLDAIVTAQQSIRLEIYIYTDSTVGREFRTALVAARRRGVRVQILIDAIGSAELPGEFWNPLRECGGEVHWFNPFRWRRFFFRNHRKLLVCDDQVAFVGGFNIAAEYEGDGLTRGWFDLGMRITGPLARELGVSFDEMFARAAMRPGFLYRLKKAFTRKKSQCQNCDLLFSGPGLRPNPIVRSLRKDLKNAKDVRIIAAYFLPSWRIRRNLLRIVRRGGRVQLILPAQSDVPLAQLATRKIYSLLLGAGVEIYEYQPQVLHAKLIMIDDNLYVGSANLDTRSLYINYELLLRLHEPAPLQEAREFFDAQLRHCKRIEWKDWKKSRSLWGKLKESWAYFLLVRVDPYIARKQFRTLR